MLNLSLSPFLCSFLLGNLDPDCDCVLYMKQISEIKSNCVNLTNQVIINLIQRKHMESPIAIQSNMINMRQ